MLSENCSMSSRPELKIDSDSVKCSHGSTVGQVDEEAIFYMQSRSIDKKLAKKILVKSLGNILRYSVYKLTSRIHANKT